MPRLTNRKAIVTGGGAGIGRAVAVALAAEGADVAIWDIDAQTADRTAGNIRKLGRTAIASPVDVAEPQQVANAFRETNQAFGFVDILINNAGICPTTPIAEITPEEWDRVMAVNLKGAFLCCQNAIGIMKALGRGWIVNISSAAGKSGGHTVGAHYSASKAGIICLTKSLAREMAPYGVRINAVAPGPVDTDMVQRNTGGDLTHFRSVVPLGRLAKPEEIASAVLFLCSSDSSYMTGATIDVNGGQLMD
jgi:NAD(P)-dependent dehydrogenase (short-subunit alcohol dehydrogenase family)